MLQKHIQILWQWINFYVIYSSNKYSDSRINFKLSHDNIINNGTTMKLKPFQEQQQKKKSEHFFKSYCWIFIKYVHTGCNKNIEPAKYLKKYTLDQKIKKYVFNFFQKTTFRFENWRSSGPPKGLDWGRPKIFKREVTSCYVSLERSFWGGSFDKSYVNTKNVDLHSLVLKLKCEWLSIKKT